MGYDLLGGVLRSISDGLQQVANLGRSNASTLESAFSEVGTATMALGTAMVAAGGLIVSGMIASAKAAADFQSQLVLLQTHAGATQADMQELGSYILTVAGQLGFNPTSLAEAVYHVQSSLTSLDPKLQNVKTDEEVLYRSAQLAAIGHASLEDSVNAVTKAFVVYSKDGYTAQQISAIFNKTVGEGNLRLQELNTAFATGLLPASEQSGISLQSLGAALATLTDLGIPATRASTYLRSAIIQMTIPSGPAADALTAIGVASNDAKSEIDTFSQVLVKAGVHQTDVSKELQKTGSLGQTLEWLRAKIVAAGLSAPDAAALIEKAFGGIRSGTGILGLYNNIDGLVQKEKDATKATQDWAKTWQIFTGQDPNQQLNELKASWDSLVIIVGYAFLPALLKIVQTITPLVTQVGIWMAKNSDLVASMIQGAAIFLLVGGAITFISGVIGRLIGFMIPIIEFFWEFGSAIAASVLSVAGAGDEFASVGAIIASSFGGPVTIAIAVIAGLIAIGVLLVTHWNQVKAFAQAVWATIGGYVTEAIRMVRGIIQSELGFILSTWNQHHAQIMAVASVVWTGIKLVLIGALILIGAAIAIVIIVIAAVVIAIIALGAFLLWLGGKFMDLVQFISGFVSRSWIIIVDYFEAIVNMAAKAWAEFAAHPAYWFGVLFGYILVMEVKIIKALIEFFIWLVGTAQKKWNEFVDTAITVLWNLLPRIWSIIQRLPGLFNDAMNWVATVIWNAGPYLLQTFTSALNGLITGAYNIGRSIVEGLWNGMNSLANWIWGNITSWLSGLIQGMKDAISSGSPSLLVAHEVGVPMAQGVALGMQMEMPNTQAVMSNLLTNLPGRAMQAVSPASSPININQRQQQELVLKIDNDVLARIVVNHINQWREITELP